MRAPVFHSDKRYAPLFLEMRRSQIQDIKDYNKDKLKVIASCSDGTYTCKILDNRRILYFKRGVKEPVPHGFWMDWEERHWKLDKPYEQHTRKQRAKMEACEQLRWIKEEFEELWLAIYNPKPLDDFWWSGGSRLKAYQETHPQFYKKIHQIYKYTR